VGRLVARSACAWPAYCLACWIDPTEARIVPYCAWNPKGAPPRLFAQAASAKQFHLMLPHGVWAEATARINGHKAHIARNWPLFIQYGLHARKGHNGSA